jgi:ribosomal protein L7/L12
VFIIDELVASGPIPGLAEDLHTCRELNFSFIAGAQSISQLATIYGDEAQVVLDGFQTQIAIAGGLDWITAEHLSRRSGISTIALPGVHEPGESDGDVAVSRHWQLSSRPVYLPSEIASPIEHPHLGMPATIIVGDGKTPAFQAYLTPCHQDGALAKMMDEVITLTVDDDLRKVPLKRSRKSASTPRKSACPDSILPPGISNTKGWTESQLKSKLEQVRKSLDWDNTTGSARKWWVTFEEENKSRVALVLRLAEELAGRKATITEFFLAYVYSNTDNIQANLHYLDYARLKKEEEAKKRKAAGEQLEKKKEESSKDKSDFDIFADNAPTKCSESKSDPGELTFVRCKSCRSLVPSNSKRCRICGLSMTVPALDNDATTGFEVTLTSWGSSKLEVVKVVKNATGKSLMDSKKLVESAPTTLGRARSREDAAKVVQEIQDAGGQARIS